MFHATGDEALNAQLAASNQKLAEAEDKATVLKAQLDESARKVDDVKDKAKIFVRDKLHGVQQHLRELDMRHAEFTARVSGSLSDGGVAVPGPHSALTEDEEALLQSVQKAVSTGPSGRGGADTPVRPLRQ